VPLTGTRPERVDLARVMSRAWVAFARDGDPNHDGLATWTPYTTSDRSRMIFDVEPHVEPDPVELREGLAAVELSWNPPPPS
jgi:para-nitrobenzyl esterase